MTAILLFSGLAALLVWLAGRKDIALDPRLTTLALALLVAFPLLAACLPKISIPPSGEIEELGETVWLVRVLGATWGIGAVIAAGRLARGAWALNKWKQRSDLLDIRGDVEIRSVEGLRGPVAAGVFRKIVFVPADWQMWDFRQRDIVIRHELAHHRRRDPLRRWIAELALVVYWFNPLVHWMARRLAVQCECECDAIVIQSGVAEETYINLLCDLAQDRLIGGPALAMAEACSLELRVRRMVRLYRTPERVPITWMIVAVSLGALLLAMSGGREVAAYPKEEIKMRLSASAFPAH